MKKKLLKGLEKIGGSGGWILITAGILITAEIVGIIMGISLTWILILLGLLMFVLGCLCLLEEL